MGKILEKKQEDQTIAAGLLMREKTMVHEKTLNLQRTKTNIADRVQRIKREKTMVAEAEKKVEGDEDYGKLGEDEGKKKAEELTKSFMRQKTLANQEVRKSEVENDVLINDLDQNIVKT